ncbi:MAG: murein biosynthesis integral membrane protein MurJ [bacterium]
MPQSPTLARSAGVVAFFTLLSRILGLARDMVVAYAFGSGPQADAFFVAFRIPNLLRRLVAEGALTASFLPVYTDCLERRTPAEADRIVQVTFTLLSLLLALITLAGVMFSPWMIRVFAPGFLPDPGRFDLAVSLNRIMFPYVFFISLVALCMGVLNARGHFAAPAAAPVLLNVAMIAGAGLLNGCFATPVHGLAVGVLAGGVLQLGLQIPPLVRRKVRFRPVLSLSDPAVNRIGRLFLPAAFGAAVYQLNVVVSNIFASFLPAGSISYLWYAGRLLEFPLGVFGMALATAAFPALSRQSSRGDSMRFRRTLEESLRLVTFITLPATVGLMMLGMPIVQVLLQRGEFDPGSASKTASALLYYSLGMWSVAVSRILTAGFYSFQDTATPVKISFASVLANVAISLALMGPMLHAGLALASSIASMLNAFLLFFYLRRRIGVWGLDWVRESGIKMLLASLIMAAILWGATALTGGIEGKPFLRQCLLLGSWVTVGGASYFGACHALSVQELRTAKGALGRWLSPGGAQSPD